MEKRLCQGSWRGKPVNENLRSRKRRLGCVSAGESWDSHKKIKQNKTKTNTKQNKQKSPTKQKEHKDMVFRASEKKVCDCKPKKDKGAARASSGEDPGKQRTPCRGGWDWNKSLNCTKYRSLGWTDEPEERTEMTRRGEGKEKLDHGHAEKACA